MIKNYYVFNRPQILILASKASFVLRWLTLLGLLIFYKEPSIRVLLCFISLGLITDALLLRPLLKITFKNLTPSEEQWIKKTEDCSPEDLKNFILLPIKVRSFSLLIFSILALILFMAFHNFFFLLPAYIITSLYLYKSQLLRIKTVPQSYRNYIDITYLSKGETSSSIISSQCDLYSSTRENDLRNSLILPRELNPLGIEPAFWYNLKNHTRIEPTPMISIPTSEPFIKTQW